MTIRSLILASLFLSTNAFAWSVPLHQSSYSAGPHKAGATISCTYTNADGQEFSGIITSTDNGTLLCSGMAVQDDDDIAIANELADRGVEMVGDDCDVVDDGFGDIVLDCPDTDLVNEVADETLLRR